jgi:hypothetical protein
VRYWYVETTDGTRSLPNRPDVPNLPVVELYSMRTGVTLTLRLAGGNAHFERYERSR